MKLLLSVIFLISSFSDIIAQNNPAKADTSVHIHEKVEIEATVIGGEMAWRRYLETYMNVMVPYNNGAPIGKYTIVVQFIIEKGGNVSDVKALTNFGYGMEEEAVRLIKDGPTWTQAMQGGKNVKAYHKQPITFVVLGDGMEINSENPYVLYTGFDNTVTIEVDNVNDKNLDVTISQGSIVSIGNRKYKALVNNPGNAIITVLNSNEKDKKIGSAYFIVKKKP